MIREFTIDVRPESVADLRRRLGDTRWPEGVAGGGGIPVAAVRRMIDEWRDGFDWFAQQAWLNSHEQVLVSVGDVTLHVVRLKGRSRAPSLPIMLLHGWPGSFVEMLPLANKLSEHFEVVVPSIPGFGFSSIPRAGGMSNARIADLMVETMAVLGYESFAIHGGDIGAGVASWTAVKYPKRVSFLHLNFIPGSYWPEPADDLTDNEREFLQRRAEWTERFGAYAHIQRTTPLTPAYALSDSPAGLAAWILEKFIFWADPSSAIPSEILLTNLSVYWLTNTIASSMCYYLESANTPLRLGVGDRVHVPTHVAHFPHEMPFPPREWVERRYAVVRWTSMRQGGHFAALEAPDALAHDIAVSTATARPA